jgi:hypothetical protein
MKKGSGWTSPVLPERGYFIRPPTGAVRLNSRRSQGASLPEQKLLAGCVRSDGESARPLINENGLKRWRAVEKF